MRKSSSSLGNGCFSPLSGLRPSVFQVYSLGGRSSPMIRRWRSGSQAMASKPLLLLAEGPRSWLGKSSWFSAVVCAFTLTTVRSCRRSSVMARLPSSSTAMPSGLFQPLSGILRSTSPSRLSSTRIGFLPMTANRVRVCGLKATSEASSSSMPGNGLASMSTW
ncbi:hypothetical protein D3C78_1499250 [compost metagenome]